MSVVAVDKISKVARWGNSLGVRIPQEAADQLNLKTGEAVRVQVKNGVMTIRKARQRKKWTLDELLEGVTPDMCGPEPWNVPVGKEIL